MNTLLAFALISLDVIFCATLTSGERVVSCGSYPLNMGCTGGVMIIQRAMYGREDNEQCRPKGDTRSHLYDPTRCNTLIDMTAVVRYHCQFQANCEVDLSKIPFKYDCSDIVPYLRVSYNCLPLLGQFTPRGNASPTSPTTKTITTTTTTSTTTAAMPKEKKHSEAFHGEEHVRETPMAADPSTADHSRQEAVSTDNEKSETKEAAADTGSVKDAESEKPAGATPAQDVYPIVGTGDLFSGWGPCPECDFCMERNGRIKCFFALHNLTWPEAKKSCVDMGGELATVRSELESRFLNRTKYIMGIHSSNAWIGLRWKQAASTWLWTDDVAMDWELSYSTFAPGEPDNWSGWESCVEFVATNLYGNQLGYYTGYWNDQECSLRRDAICQKYWLLA